MDRYQWTDKGKSYGASATEGGRLLAPLPTLDECPAALPDYSDQLHRQDAISAAARELLRLAEENERLRTAEATGLHRSVQAERTRVRRELLASVTAIEAVARRDKGDDDFDQGALLALKAVRMGIDRICPLGLSWCMAPDSAPQTNRPED